MRHTVGHRFLGLCLSALLCGTSALTAWAQTQQTPVQTNPAQTNPTQQPANPSLTLPGPAELSPPSPTFPGAALFNDQPPFLTGVAVDRGSGTYRDGETLRVQFLAERDAHLYLLYHQADGSSLLLFPNEARANNRVMARQPIVVPSPGEKFRFRISPPLGREVLQVVASVQPVAELDSLVAKSGRAPVVTPELLQKLAERLLQDRASWTEHRVPIQTMAKEPESPRTPARVGLFIGIGKYLHPEIGATHVELARSAEVMHELMLRHGGLDPQRTRLVLNEQATKANFQELIVRWLPSVSQPGDTVFIYFSGHAGQVDCLDNSEADNKDECLGPYDLDGFHRGDTLEQARARFRQTNIVDDTLARWLQELSGRQVVLILDTCHSGGVVDGKGFAKSFLKDEAQRMKDISQLNMIVLTSCAADEQSLFEGTRNKTMWFTYCLTEAIETAAKSKQTLLVQQAFEYTRTRMRELLQEGNAAREQEPQIMNHALLPLLLVP